MIRNLKPGDVLNINGEQDILVTSVSPPDEHGNQHVKGMTPDPGGKEIGLYLNNAKLDGESSIRFMGRQSHKTETTLSIMAQIPPQGGDEPFYRD